MEGEGSPLKFWPILIKFRMLTVCYIPGLHTKFHQNRPKKKEVEKSGDTPGNLGFKINTLLTILRLLPSQENN